MTNEQILKQAIEKCEDKLFNRGVFSKSYIDGWIEQRIKEVGVYGIIFSHDFAKAFWGKREISSQDILKARGSNCRYFWQYHLQRMVLEKNPLAHLREFL